MREEGCSSKEDDSFVGGREEDMFTSTHFQYSHSSNSCAHGSVCALHGRRKWEEITGNTPPPGAPHTLHLRNTQHRKPFHARAQKARTYTLPHLSSASAPCSSLDKLLPSPSSSQQREPASPSSSRFTNLHSAESRGTVGAPTSPHHSLTSPPRRHRLRPGLTAHTRPSLLLAKDSPPSSCLASSRTSFGGSQ